MRPSTTLFLGSVVPPIASVVVLSVSYFRGGITGKNLMTVLLLMILIWVVAFIWGFIDRHARKARRIQRKTTDKNPREIPPD